MTDEKAPSKPDEIGALKKKFRGMLEKETDRGLAIVGPAFFDDALAELLRAYLLDDPKVVEDLLRQGGPIGSFKIRCDLAYTLGLVGVDMHSDLH